MSADRRIRVTVDARPAVFARPTGIGLYTRRLLQLMPALDANGVYTAWYLNAGDLRRIARGRRRFDGGPANLRERGTPVPARWFEIASQRARLPRVEWFTRFDVLFAPNFLPPPTASTRTVLTVHDLAFRLVPESAPQSTRWWLARLDEALERAGAILVPSEATRRDLLETCAVEEARVTVIPHGVDAARFARVPADAIEKVRVRLRLPDRYLLFLGGIEPRKNLARVVRAYASIDASDRPALVLAGAGVAWNPEGRRELEAALAGVPANARPSIVLTGYVDEAHKPALVAGALALVYPSLSEGFGLPVLEAMAAGTAVLTSDVAALREVAGDAALLVDPEDDGAVAEGIRRIAADDGLRARLSELGIARAARFTWEESARRTIDVLHRVAGDDAPTGATTGRRPGG